MKKKITLKIIAQHLNVSIATVSKALKNSHEISESTKSKIQKFAKEHNYKPNIFALNLKQKRTKTIGIIIPNILNLFFAKVFSGIEKIANEKSFNLTICISNDSYKKEVDATEMLMNSNVDGIIVSLAQETQKTENYDHFKNVINQGTSLVMFDRVTDQIDCDKVIVDDLKAAFNATQFFINTKHRRIALISNISHTSVGKLRLNGYLKALEANQIAIDKNLIIKLNEHDDIEPHLKIIFGSKNVDALLCLEESTAISALEIVKKQGLAIPNDISIIGFTNGQLPKHVTPKLTTVSQHGVYVGESAMIFLNEQINANNLDQTITSRLKIVKTTIIERESTLKL